MKFSSVAGLVLASGSRARKALLDQLRIPYVVCPADIDEATRSGEAPSDLAARLAREKAQAVAERFPSSLIIGADQVASLDGRNAFSKPSDHASAVSQLSSMSGQRVVFHSAVCLVNAYSGTLRTALVPTEVRFRTLTAAMIEQYLQIDQPYDCAGSARIESLGIALVEGVSSDDPSALLGLPLIVLVDLLAAEGVTPLC